LIKNSQPFGKISENPRGGFFGLTLYMTLLLLMHSRMVYG